MDEALFKRLREKILKGLMLQTEGPALSELFLLIQDLNYLHFCLLCELGKLSSGDYLTPEILAALLKIESSDDNKIIMLGRELLKHSKGDLLQGAALSPLICLHTLPDPTELVFPKTGTDLIQIPQLTEKNRIIALLLEQIRLLKGGK